MEFLKQMDTWAPQSSSDLIGVGWVGSWVLERLKLCRILTWVKEDENSPPTELRSHWLGRGLCQVGSWGKTHWPMVHVIPNEESFGLEAG